MCGARPAYVGDCLLSGEEEAAMQTGGQEKESKLGGGLWMLLRSIRPPFQPVTCLRVISIEEGITLTARPPPLYLAAEAADQQFPTRVKPSSGVRCWRSLAAGHPAVEEEEGTKER